MTSFHVENFGCRAARADGEAVSARLESYGMSTLPLGKAEVVIVNTCSVTAEADREARAFIRRSKRLNPAAKVVVTGCYAQRASQEIAALDGVTAVVGNSHKALVPEIVLRLGSSAFEASPQLIPAANLISPSQGQTIWADDSFAHSSLDSAQVLPGAQTRPNLKIQEGCSNRCTFCIIPTTRGNSRSLEAVKVLSQVRGFVAAGGKELVLSGINLGRWGRDLNEDNKFAMLVRAIVETTDLPRLRLSSIEPMDWTTELIGLFREHSPNHIARHAHLPLQAGSDSVLRRMHRRYRPWHYAAKVAQLIEAVGPELALGADVMVGFPGETDTEFRETYDFIATHPFTYLHLFPFSARPGTRGYELHRQSPVSSNAVHERMAALQALIAYKSRRFRESFLDRMLPAITLNSRELLTSASRTSALTDNFLPVKLSEPLPPNQLVKVHVTGINNSSILQAKPIYTQDSQPVDLAVAI